MIKDRSEQEPRPGNPAADEQPAQDASPPEVQSELDDLMDRLKRMTADYQNYQKRVVREIAEARRYANAELAKEILTTVDDLLLATGAATVEKSKAADAGEEKTEKAIDSLLNGMRITYDHLMATLARHGVTPIESAGQPFDPQLHEAMMQQPSADVPPLTVLQELRKGYRIHDRVLRPARVIVSAAASREKDG